MKKKCESREEQKQIVSEKAILEVQVVAAFFNNFFINIVPNLKISLNHNYDTDFIVTNDQVTNALNKFRNHPSSPKLLFLLVLQVRINSSAKLKPTE